MPFQDEYFSNLPEDVIREWLPNRVRNLGWPPEQNLGGWTKVLGEVPEQWRLNLWRAGSVDLRSITWREDSQTTISELKETCFGTPASASWARHAPHGIQKMQQIQLYAMQHRALPSRLLITETPSGIFLVDGYHRVTWFNYMSDLLGAALPVSSIAQCYIGAQATTDQTRC